MTQIGAVAASRRRFVPAGGAAALTCRSGWVPRNNVSPAAAIAIPSGSCSAENWASVVWVRVIARITPGYSGQKYSQGWRNQ